MKVFHLFLVLGLAYATEPLASSIIWVEHRIYIRNDRTDALYPCSYTVRARTMVTSKISLSQASITISAEILNDPCSFQYCTFEYKSGAFPISVWDDKTQGYVGTPTANHTGIHKAKQGAGAEEIKTSSLTAVLTSCVCP